MIKKMIREKNWREDSIDEQTPRRIPNNAHSELSMSKINRTSEPRK